MTKPKIIFVVAAVCCLLASEAYARGVVYARGVRRNVSGGVTARSGTAFRGPSGGEAARGRSVVTDGQGNATKTSGAAYRGPNGTTANRSSTATVANDGSATRNSSASASGAKGSVQTSAGYQRNGDGTASSTRNTTATGSNGNTYQGNTTWTKGSGAQHTGTCKDSAGNVITCSGR
jgi:hypothetical protein